MQAQVACRIATMLVFGGGFKFGDFYFFLIAIFCVHVCKSLHTVSNNSWL